MSQSVPMSTAELGPPERSLAATVGGSVAFIVLLVVGHSVSSVGALIGWLWVVSSAGLGLVAGVSTGRRASGLSGRDRREMIGGGVLSWGLLFPVGFVLVANTLYGLLQGRVAAVPSGFMLDLIVFRYVAVLAVLEVIGFGVGLLASVTYEWATASDRSDHGQ